MKRYYVQAVHNKRGRMIGYGVFDDEMPPLPHTPYLREPYLVFRFRDYPNARTALSLANAARDDANDLIS